MIPSEKEAIELLKKYAPDEKSFRIVFSHCRMVKDIALRVADKVPQADKELIKIGALLHDMGRFIYPPPGMENAVKHGLAGADLLRNERVDEAICNITERHVGIGISKQDIIGQKLPLPHVDLVPVTVEEKIVAYADNLVFGHKEGTEKMVEERFAKEIGPEYGIRTRKFHDMMHKLMGL